MRGEQIGSYFAGYSNYQAGDPYNPERSDIPRLGEIIGAPIKAGMYYNAAKMAYHGSFNLGIIGDLKDPFTEINQYHRFRSKTVSKSNPIRTLLERSSPTKRNWNSPSNVAARKEILQFEKSIAHGFSQSIANDKPKAWYNKFINTGTSTEFDDYKNNASMGLRNRYLVRPNLLADMMESTLESTRITNNSELGKEYVQKLYKERARTGSTPIKPSFMSGDKTSKLFDLKEARKKHITTAWDVITGSTSKSSKATRLERSKDILFGNKGLVSEIGLGSEKDQIFKLKRWKMFNGKDAYAHAARSEAFMSLATEQGAGAIKAGSKDVANKYSMMIGNHINRSRLMRNVGGAYFGVQIAAEIVRGSFKAGMTGLSRLGSTLKESRKMEFGGDDVLMNSRMSSERQRAIGEIQNAQMNARYLLGSEAQMYHQ